MDKVLKVATPAMAAMVLVPLRVPVPEAMEITTLEVSVVTMLLYWSSTLTTILEMVWPAVVVEGWVVMTNLLAAAARW